MKKSSMKFSAAFSKFMFYFGNIVIGIIFVSPLIWMISASLKPESQIFANMNSLKTFFPVSASFNNYVEVFTRMNLPQVFKNTLLYIALILVLDLLVNSMCGYALAKFDFKGKGLVMTGEDKRTIQLAVQSFFGTQPVHYSAIMAALVVSAIPMIIMFIFMQKYYVEGIASSGIKG